ncbi:MAG: glycoside hydrolase family 35 protein [Steroidobacteraceae bacterium]
MTTRRDFLTGTASLGTTMAIAARIVPARGKVRFNVSDGRFVLDGRPFQVLAGEMHYPRTPRELWRDRMQKLRSLGLNTLSTYVFWNAHEPQPGHFEFSGNLDVAAYIRMAQEEGLWVNLRPGPYVCGEWDGGGIPAWVSKDSSIEPRSLDERYMRPVRSWLKRLGEELTPLLISNGGPIILTQVENEYGSYGSDPAYMRASHEALRAARFDGVFYTADGAEVMAGGILPELPAGLTFGTHDHAETQFAIRAKHRTDGPFFCAELWGGWYDHFGEMHSNLEIPPLVSSLQWMLERGYSINLYMLHGGTSFGFSAGANYPLGGPYQPDISSYDYDAILDEAGRPTPKYEAVKAVLARYVPPGRFAELPAQESGIEIARFRLRECAPLAQLMGSPIPGEQPLTLEALGQNQGLLLYRHRAHEELNGELDLGEVRDYALISSASDHWGTLDRRLGESRLQISCPADTALDVLVDTMGHVNYGPQLGKDQKGLTGVPRLNGAPLTGWEHYGLPLDDINRLQFAGGASAGKAIAGPAFYRSTFTIARTGYTFLDLRGWGKGYVWINGHNLGRYWSVGPQRALFVPAPWLKAGENEVIVLDLHASGERTLAGGTQQIWDQPGLVKV